jgi:hypothetical protein
MRLLDPSPEPEPPRRQIGFHVRPGDETTGGRRFVSALGWASHDAPPFSTGATNGPLRAGARVSRDTHVPERLKDSSSR